MTNQKSESRERLVLEIVEKLRDEFEYSSEVHFSTSYLKGVAKELIDVICMKTDSRQHSNP